MSCTELRMAVRTIGIISTEGARQTLCSQLADNSMTTVKKKKKKQPFVLSLFCFIWNYFHRSSQLSFGVCFPLLSVTATIISGPSPWKTHASNTQTSLLSDPLRPHSSTLMRREGRASTLHPAALVCTSTGAFISNSPAISTNISSPVQRTLETKQTSKFMDSCHASNSYRIKKNRMNILHSPGDMTYLTSEMTEHTLKSAVMHCTVETARLTAPLSQSPQLRDHFGRPKIRSQPVAIFSALLDPTKINCYLHSKELWSLPRIITSFRLRNA